MKFVPITPEEWLMPYAMDRDFGFVLGHLLGDNPYTSFYEHQVRNGMKLIFDNGAYENPLPMQPEEIMDLFSEHLYEIALPDVLFDPSETIRLHLAAMLRMREYMDLPVKQRRFTRLMIIPQGTNPDLWIDCAWSLLQHASEIIPNIPLTVGVPRHMAAHTGGRSALLHFRLMKIYRMFNEDVAIHFLGINEKPSELRTLALIHGEHIRSIDSAKPFVYAHQGLDWTDGTVSDTVKRPSNYFDLPESRNSMKPRIKRNLYAMDRVVEAI